MASLHAGCGAPAGPPLNPFMSALKKSRRVDRDPGLAPTPEIVPVQTTFRHLPSSPALAARVEAETQKLLRYSRPILSCHAVIVAPHRHRQQGRHFSVHLELSLPGERLAITHEAAGVRRTAEVTGGTKATETEADHKDAYVVLRKAFDSARRRLQDYARRRRGEVKLHRSKTAARAK